MKKLLGSILILLLASVGMAQTVPTATGTILLSSSGGGGGGPAVPISTINGGFGVNVSAVTGYAKAVSGTWGFAAIPAGDLPAHNHAASDITSGALSNTRGGTAADLSATGGQDMLAQQATVGGAFTIGQFASLSGATANVTRLINNSALTTAQKLEIYSTADASPPVTNYARVAISQAAGATTITNEKGGTGTDTGITVQSAGNVTVNSSGGATVLKGGGLQGFSITSSGIPTVCPTCSLDWQGANSSFFRIFSTNEQLTLSTGAATTDTVGNILPANSIILAVSARVTTTITTCANWSLGDANVATRFTNANTNLTAGTQDATGFNQWNPANANNAGALQAAAAKLRVTCNVTPGAGVVRIIVWYLTQTAPTS